VQIKDKESEMRQHRWFYLLLITGLLLSSCQTTDVAVFNPDSQTASQAKVNPLTVQVSAQNANVVAELEESECLNCHADKERLIETAKEEEVVEAESSGVG
jgi:hypothetical protein